MSTNQIEKELKENNKELEKNLKKEEISKTIEQEAKSPIQEFKPVEKEKKNPLSILGILIFIIISILVIAFLIFTGYNALNQNIVSGVHIKDVDVSNMSKSDARYQIENYITNTLPEEITLKHGDYQTTISLSQIGVSFDVKNAVNDAYNVGRQGNLFQNNFYVLSTMFGKVNIEPKLNLDVEQLTQNLNEISTQLPDKVIESSYYIEDNNLIITRGTEGNVVDIEATIEAIKSAISNFSIINNPIEIVVKSQSPAAIDIEQIHNEIYKEPKDAYYTQNPFAVYPSENGLDFDISIDEAKNILGDQSAEEYTIPLKTLYPSVTTNMIGTEAFPDLLSSYSTKYSTRDRDRTTNLQLAANKINGTVLMPGETFSYNKVVGERTIAAGYKEAPIYVSGEVIDGLGGGICQITSTLYNAVVYANLEIVSRSNHRFLTSYVEAGRDATVSWGTIDFQFKNTRTYPIRIEAEAKNGVCKMAIYGIKEETEYEVLIQSVVNSYLPYTTVYEDDPTLAEGKEVVEQSGYTGCTSEAYRILKLNGEVVSKTLLSKDTYDPMTRIIRRGTKPAETIETSNEEENNDINSNNEMDE